MRNHILLNKTVYVVRGAGSNVGNAPGCLELEFWNFMIEELDEFNGQVCVNYCLNRRRVLDGEQLPHANKAHKFRRLVLEINELAKNVEVFELEFHFVCYITGEGLNVELVLLLEFQCRLDRYRRRVQAVQVWRVRRVCSRRLLLYHLLPFAFDHIISKKAKFNESFSKSESERQSTFPNHLRTYLFLFLRPTVNVSLSYFVFLFVSPGFNCEIRSSAMFLSAFDLSS